MKKYSTIIFDLDGTLLNTLTDLTNAVNHTMKMFGYEEKTIEQVRTYVGNGLKVLMECCIPKESHDKDLEAALEELKSYYGIHSRDFTVPYEGINELIDELYTRDIKMAIVSNKVDFAVKELAEVFWGGKITVAIGESDAVRRKPAPDTALKALEELGADKSETVYVGDSEVDIATAKNAGLDCISVLWGFRDRDTLVKNGAQTFVGAPEEILEYVK